MRRALIAAWLALGAGCSLIVDTDAVRARRDAGAAEDGGAAAAADAADAGPVASDAMAPDAMSPDAAAPDAAAPDAEVSPCARPDAGLLRCGAPITLSTGVDLSLVSIAALSDGFVAALVEDRAVVTRTLGLDGAVRATFRSPSSVRPTGLQVAGNGERWAVAYAPGLGNTLRCASSLDTRTSSVTTVDPVDDVAVAVGPTGVVALGGVEGYTISTELARAVSAAPGCPSTAERVSPAYYTRGVAAMHVPGGGPGEFRFAVSATHPNLVDSVVAEIAGTGSEFNWLVYGGLGIRGVEVAPASFGAHMAVAYAWRDEDTRELGLWGALHRVDFSGPPATEVDLAPDVADFDFASCGDALVAAYLWAEGRGRISATFLAPDVSLETRGASSVYDVACTTPATGEVDVACAGGKLAVLYTQGARADLYLCEVPDVR